MRFSRKVFWLAALIGAVGLSSVPEARAATSSAASKSFYSLVSGKGGAIKATATGGSAFRQEILAQIRANRLNFTSSLVALRQDFRSGGLSVSEFRYNRSLARFNFLVQRGILVFTLRFGRPPVSPGF